MPAKYSHVKKRPPVVQKKNGGTANGSRDEQYGSAQGTTNAASSNAYSKRHHSQSISHSHPNHPNPLMDKTISQALTAISQLEHTISRILLIRYEQDIARLFSTHIHNLSLMQLPTFVLRCISVGGMGWLVWNAGCEEVKEFFRGLIGMELREAGERVATKSVLWSYTALRQFAMSNNIPICNQKGLHSLRLLPYYPALKSHLESLETMPAPTFSKPPHLGTLREGQQALEDACMVKFSHLMSRLVGASEKEEEGEEASGGSRKKAKGESGEKKRKKTGNGDKSSSWLTQMDYASIPLSSIPPFLQTEWINFISALPSSASSLSGKAHKSSNGTTADDTDGNEEWKLKLSLGYENLVKTLWQVALEFDVRGYGLVLREKLIKKWCECGCSTDQLGEVCEKTVREEEEQQRKRKEKEGRGANVGQEKEKDKGKGKASAAASGTNGGGCHHQAPDRQVGVRVGKMREWDGRGSGVYGWETEEEEDIWDVRLDFAMGVSEPTPTKTNGKSANHTRISEMEDEDDGLTIGEMMELRYLKAENEKEQGNAAYRKGDYVMAIQFYTTAHEIEPELPHYQLNIAAAHLKLNNWIEAEAACTTALGQHKSTKGYYRRARARRMLSRTQEAIKDLCTVLRIQSTNTEALKELMELIPLLATKAAKGIPRCVEELDQDMLERLGLVKAQKKKAMIGKGGEGANGRNSRDREREREGNRVGGSASVHLNGGGSGMSSGSGSGSGYGYGYGMGSSSSSSANYMAMSGSGSSSSSGSSFSYSSNSSSSSSSSTVISSDSSASSNTTTSTTIPTVSSPSTPTPKQTQPVIPWKKTSLDERKIKIFMMAPAGGAFDTSQSPPGSFLDQMRELGVSGGCCGENGCSHSKGGVLSGKTRHFHWHFCYGDGKGGGTTTKGGGGGGGKLKDRKMMPKMIELEELRKKSPSYPSWDRYYIQKVD